MTQELWFASFLQLIILYSIEFGTLILLLRKYGRYELYFLLILLFYPAIFAFMGKNINNGYKIIVLILTLYLIYIKQAFGSFKKGDLLITIFFSLFSLCYAISTYNNNDGWTIIFSQYSRYLIAYCLWFLIRQELVIVHKDSVNLMHFSYDLLVMQIIITIGKFLIFGGRQIESIVGSVSHLGGAAGTIIPILGFIVLWFYRKSVLSRKDWLFIAGLMLIGFMAGKRAVWFILPFIIAVFTIYIPRKVISNTNWLVLFLSPFAFYLGVRLTPTLNPENKVWGSFNLNYAFNYANKYQFGEDSNDDQKQAQGRGGVTLMLLKKLNSDSGLDAKDWIGFGLTKMYATDYEEFSENNSEINSKGSATGVYQTYLTTGYLGIVFTLAFFFSMIWQIRLQKIKWVIIFIVAWEYFMYTGIIFRTPAFMVLIIYFVHYSNYLQYTARLKSVDKTIN